MTTGPARMLNDHERRLKALEITPQLAHSTLTGAIPERNDAGELVGLIGLQPDGSYAHVVLDGPLPRQPTEPGVEEGALAIRVTWDGFFRTPEGKVDPGLAPFADTEQVEIHLGATEGAIFTRGTYRGGFTKGLGGTLEIPAKPGTWWVRLVCRSAAGRYGLPSASMPVVVQARASEDDLIAVALGQHKVTFGPGYPPNPKLDDIHYKGPLEGPYLPERYTGTEWVPATLADGALEELSVGRLVSGTIGIGVTLTVGDTAGEHSEISGTEGIRYMVPGPVTDEGLGEPVPVTKMGRAYAVVDIESGEILGALSEDGSHTGPLGDFDVVRAGGDDISELIDTRPLGDVAGNNWTANKGPYTTRTGYVAVAFDALAGRRYEIIFHGGVQTTNAGGNAMWSLRWEYSDLGTTPLEASVNSPLLAYATVPTVNADVVTASISKRVGFSTNKRVNIILCVGPNTAATESVKAVGPIQFYVEDKGIPRGAKGFPTLGGAAQSPGVPVEPPPPAQPPSSGTTGHYYFGWMTPYSQFGQATAHTSNFRQGTMPGVQSRYASIAGNVQTKLYTDVGSSADRIEWAEVYLFNVGYRNGTARIGWHGLTAPGATAPTPQDGFNAYLPVNTGRYFRVPAAWHAAIAPGTLKGIMVGNVNVSHDFMDFGRPDNSRVDRRPHLRVRLL